MLYKNIMLPKASEVPGAHGDRDKPLLLEFHGNFVQNRSEIVTREFSRMLYKNIMSPMICEVPGAQGAPLLLEFQGNFVQSRSQNYSPAF